MVKEGKKKTAELQKPIKQWHNQNLKVIWENSKKRIILIAIVLPSIFGFLGLLNYIRPFVNGVDILIITFILLPFIFLGVLYFYRSSMQLFTQAYLSKQLGWMRIDIACITEMNKQAKENRDVDWDKKQRNNRHFLLTDLNKARGNLKEYINLSEVISPPIFNYELDRLQKGLDIFFNCSGEILFPCDNSFSDSMAFEKMQDEYFDSMEVPFSHPLSSYEIEEIEREVKEENKLKHVPDPRVAEIQNFDFQALDQFTVYLGKVLFSRVRPHSVLRYKHSINIIELSKFFSYWNVVLASCNNSKDVYIKVKEDVDGYYKSINRATREHKQRLSRLTDSILILVLSVGLSAIVTYSMKLAGIV